jgi:MAP/microtubule affinity-regulating kinase
MIEAQTLENARLSIPRQFRNYTAVEKIGQGSTCAVLDAVDRSTGKSYAVKVMSQKNLEQRHLLLKVEREASILRQLCHANVIQFHECFRDGDLLFLVTENCAGGDLLKWISEERLSSAAAQTRVFYEICLGIQYLHNRGIAHNDIKPDNVIMDCAGSPKLIDFGYAKTDAVAGDNDKNGTLMYAAPELFRRGCYSTQKADIWSLGILLFTIVTGIFPFLGNDDHRIVRQIRHGDLSFPTGMNCEAELLIRRLTKVNPNERPTIDEVLEDPYFAGLRDDPGKAACVPLRAAEISGEDVIDAGYW